MRWRIHSDVHLILHMNARYQFAKEMCLFLHGFKLSYGYYGSSLNNWYSLDDLHGVKARDMVVHMKRTTWKTRSDQYIPWFSRHARYPVTWLYYA